MNLKSTFCGVMTTAETVEILLICYYQAALIFIHIFEITLQQQREFIIHLPSRCYESKLLAL
jgi:hypothetical protein